jgi:hypothetical protein
MYPDVMKQRENGLYSVPNFEYFNIGHFRRSAECMALAVTHHAPYCTVFNSTSLYLGGNYN